LRDPKLNLTPDKRSIIGIGADPFECRLQFAEAFPAFSNTNPFNQI
jgi:hypothetical protein